MNRLSVCLIVKNEEKYLAGCLESVKEIADEIIVADTGSTDKTKKIAKSYGSKIFDFEWTGSFSDARNFALSKCNGELILYIDADERLAKESFDELRRIKESGKEKTGYFCQIYNYDRVSGIPKIFSYIRLFGNSNKIAFTGRVHEQIETSLVKENYRLEDTGIRIDHIGYDTDITTLQKKAERNLQLLLEDHRREKTPYTAYQLGNTYAIVSDAQNAVRYYSEALSSDQLHNSYRAVACTYIINYELAAGNIDKARLLFERSVNRFGTDMQILLTGVQVYYANNNIRKSFHYFKEALFHKRNGKEEAGKNLELVFSENKIFSLGLEIAVKSEDMEFFTYVINQLSKDPETGPLVEIIKPLFYNRSLTNKNHITGISGIPKEYLGPLLYLLERYTYNKMSIEVIKKLIELFPGEGFISTSIGLLYQKSGLVSLALPAFNKALRDDKSDFTALFYYVSLALKENRIEEIHNIIGYAEKRFAGDVFKAGKILSLKQKLGNLPG